LHPLIETLGTASALVKYLEKMAKEGETQTPIKFLPYISHFFSTDDFISFVYLSLPQLKEISKSLSMIFKIANTE